MESIALDRNLHVFSWRSHFAAKLCKFCNVQIDNESPWDYLENYKVLGKY